MNVSNGMGKVSESSPTGMYTRVIGSRIVCEARGAKLSRMVGFMKGNSKMAEAMDRGVS